MLRMDWPKNGTPSILNGTWTLRLKASASVTALLLNPCQWGTTI